MIFIGNARTNADLKLCPYTPVGSSGAPKRRRPLAAAFRAKCSGNSALASLEARVALADHEHLATTTHDLAVAVPLLGGFKRRQNFHDVFPVDQAVNFPL
jgi:hypothetical protein